MNFLVLSSPVLHKAVFLPTLHVNLLIYCEFCCPVTIAHVVFALFQPRSLDLDKVRFNCGVTDVMLTRA